MELETLEVKIQAQARQANGQIDALITRLGKLSSSLQSIDSSGINRLATGVNRLSNSMSAMRSVDSRSFSTLARNIKTLSSIDTGKINAAAGAMRQISKSVSSFSGMSKSVQGLAELAGGIKQLGYTSSTKAIENIPKLAVAMRQLMAELSKAPMVSQNLINMTNALAKLARTGASSGRAASSLGSALDRYTASTHRAKKGSFSLASAIGKVYATYWMLFRAMRLFRKAIDISSQLTEVQNVVDVTFGNMAYKVEDFAKTSIQQFGMSELSLKQYASRFQAMGSAMGISGSSIGSANDFLSKQTKGYVGASNSMADMSLNLTKLTADMASFYNVEQKVVAEDLEAIFTGQTRPLRQYGLDLTQATLREWALKNGIDADVKSMSQAEKTMLRYQYVMANTGAAQGDFARTANTWANQVRILKQNFQQLGAVVGGTLINAFKPLVQALNSVMGNLIAFAETVSNALGKIFGWKFEKSSGGAGTTGLATDMEDAADSAGGLADKTGKAAKNIDKMKAGIRAFDELKTINMPDRNSGSGGGSGSGGSGGGASGASGSGGQWVKQNSIFEDYKSSIDSLKGLGNYIRDALIGEMESIDWDSVYKKADNFGKGLANFLNGLFEADKNGNTVFGELGTTIAGALNTVLHGLDSFGKTFDWTQFGASIADGINNFFSTFDFGLLADTINTWAHGLIDSATEAISGTDWTNVGTKIGELLAKIDFIGILKDVGNLIWEAIKAAVATWEGMFDAAPIETAIITAIGLLKFTGVGSKIVGAISSSVTSFLSSKGLSIGKVAFGISFAAATFVLANSDNELESMIAAPLTAFISGKTFGLNTKLSLGFAGVTLAFTGGLNLGQAIGNAIADATQPEEMKQYRVDFKFSDLFTYSAEEWKQGFKDWWSDTFGPAFSLMWDDIESGDFKIRIPFTNFELPSHNELSDALSLLWDDVVSGDFKFKIPFTNFELPSHNEIVEGFTEWLDNVKKWWGKKKDAIVEFGAKIKDKASDLWNGLKNSWNNVKGKVAGFKASILSKASDLWNNFKKSWGESKVANFLLSITSKASDLWEKFKNSWGKTRTAQFLLKIFSKASDLWNDFKTKWGSTKKVNIGIGFVRNALSNLWSSVTSFFSGKKISVGASATKKADGGVFSGGSWKPIKKYAVGGLPNMGQMFIAREAGPELVGTLGGHTAVMNNDQIVSSVSYGVAQAVKEVIQPLVKMGGGNNRPIQISLDGKVIFDSTRQSAQEYFNRTGMSPFPV